MPFESTVGESDLEIGQDYFGSTVVKVKQEVEEKGNKYRIKRFVTLQSGMILIEEYIRERSQGKVEPKEYGLSADQIPEEKPKDDSEARAKARAMIAKNREKKKDPKKKSKKKKSKSMPAPRPRRNSVRKPDIYDVPAKVVPDSKLIDAEGSAPVIGSWKHDDGTDDTKWDPMDVVISEEPIFFLEPGEPHGIVALEEGAKPDEDGKVDPYDLKFFPPGEDPPPTDEKVGYWRPKKSDQAYPPKKPEPKTNNRPTEKMKLPSFDDFAKVLPKSKLPDTRDTDAPQMGVWKHDDGTDDSDWDPMDVLLSEEPPSDLDPGEPSGVVAVKKDAKPNACGEVDPSDLEFFPPGKDPPSNYNTIGWWRPEKLGQVWPPKRRKLNRYSRSKKPVEEPLPDFDGDSAIVYPKAKLPDAQDDDKYAPHKGVWEHNDDTDDDDWDPMEIFISKYEFQDLAPEEPTGIVAVKEGTKPNPSTGKLDPSDLKFFTPGDDPPRGFNKVGHWRPKKLDQEWPPGDLPLPDFDGDFARVFPKSKLPWKEDEDDPQMGVWKHNDNATDDSDWDPKDVIISKEPVSFLDEGEPHGIVAVKEGTKPDKTTGKLDPSDLNFFTPGENPPRGYKKVGHWRPGKLNQEWPPGKPTLPDFDGDSARVFPKSKLPWEQDEDEPQVGTWKHNDNTDDSDWDPIDVFISKNPPSDLDRQKPHGIVAVPDGTKPNISTGKLDPDDLKFFTPGEKPPHGYNKVGHWRPKKLNQEWPPGKLPIPDSATVFPQSKLPTSHGKYDPDKGVWKHNDGTDDSDWDPVDVVITEDPPSDLNPDEPNGIVAVKDGTKPDDSTGKLNPNDLKFFAPGEKPPRKFKKVGHWRHKKLNQEWPPGKSTPPIPKTATVFPKSKAPSSQGKYDPDKGVWKHNDDTDDSDWDPMDVVITEDPPSDLKPGEPNGIVAVEEGTKPNKVGKLDPNDLNFFTPGEKPRGKFNKVGHWRPKKLNQEWPPGKLPIPKAATVFPKSKAPSSQGKHDPDKGVWKHNNDTDDSDWDPLDVVITEDPPSDLNPDEPNGIVAVAEGTKPNKVGKLDPNDLKFYPPGEKPRGKFNKVGHWRPKKLNQEWPPGKLPIPDAATVFPRWNLPNSQGKYDPDQGVWKHNDDTDDSDWDPLDVVITEDPPSDLEPGEPNGIVAVEEGTKPNKVGKLDPNDLKFFTPGDKPRGKFNKVGHWRPKKLNQEWPPGKRCFPELDKATVFPTIDLPLPQSEEDERDKGVWKHNNNTDDSEWEPVDVVITKEPVAFLEPGEPSGIVAVKEGTRPNKIGKLNPEDLKFFTPGEKPPRTFNKLGHWRAEKLNQEWPPVRQKPKSKFERKPREFEKASLFNFDGDLATVTPLSKLADRKRKDGPLVGVWKHNDDTDDSDWDPMKVVLTKDPPSDNDEFGGIVAVEDGVKPDINGRVDPSDLKLFTPGEEPPSNFEKVGHWKPAEKASYPPSPPKKTGGSQRDIGKVHDTRKFKEFTKPENAVGKLRMPSFFKNK